MKHSGDNADFAVERALADAALASRGSDGEQLPFPSSHHLTAAREQAGLSEVELTRRFGTEGYLCPDLEHRSGEIFDCESIADLLHLGAVLNASVSTILCGSEPAEPLEPIGTEEVAARLRERCARESTTPEALGDAIGWAIEPLLADSDALLTYNIQGLHDITSAVGVDWLAVIVACENGP